jgi:hypothetical protein
LPADSFGYGGGGEQAVVAPPAAALLTVGPGGRDLDADAGQGAGGEAIVQLLSEFFGREHDRLGSWFGRVELLGHGQVGGRLPGSQRPGAEPAGQPVRVLPRLTEPAGHVAGGQRGEIPERAQAQPVQQAGQVLISQDAYWLIRQEPRRAARRNHGDLFWLFWLFWMFWLFWGAALVGAGGEQCGEQPVGDAYLDAGACLGAGVRQRGDDPGGQCCLAAEVAGRAADAERAHPRLHYLHVRAEPGHDRDHPLVPPRDL